MAKTSSQQSKIYEWMNGSLLTLFLSFCCFSAMISWSYFHRRRRHWDSTSIFAKYKQLRLSLVKSGMYNMTLYHWQRTRNVSARRTPFTYGERSRKIYTLNVRNTARTPNLNPNDEWVTYTRSCNIRIQRMFYFRLVRLISRLIHSSLYLDIEMGRRRNDGHCQRKAVYISFVGRQRQPALMPHINRIPF